MRCSPSSSFWRPPVLVLHGLPRIAGCAISPRFSSVTKPESIRHGARTSPRDITVLPPPSSPPAIAISVCCNLRQRPRGSRRWPRHSSAGASNIARCGRRPRRIYRVVQRRRRGHHRRMAQGRMVASQPATPTGEPTEMLAGSVERVVFHNPENGFCVLRLRARGHREAVTVVGHVPLIAAGEFVQASGVWANDRTHGMQFRAAFLKPASPTTREGIEKYLASGMLRGIGPVYAKKLVRAFGEAVVEVIDNTPQKLRQIPGIGPP